MITCPVTTPMKRNPVKACNPMVVIENGWINASIPDTAITPKRRALKREMTLLLFMKKQELAGMSALYFFCEL